jgi:DNA-binding NarL/FixJ family response regulator
MDDYTQENETIKRQKQRGLNKYFDTIISLKQRDKTIKEVVEDGCKQSKITEFLQLSRTTISKIIVKVSQ